MKLKIEVWKDRKSEWRWHAKRCGRIVACSGEGYKNLKALQKAFFHLAESLGKHAYEIADKKP